jgi:23S rRNA (uracil1939-C5)-methyltransferase/tRNA (uracil-5-)-methyltransferase
MRCLVDAYCGVGVFCLSASAVFDRLAGVEISTIAIHWANANAAINGIDNCQFIIGRAEEIFGGIDFRPRETAVVVDPPRKGCDQSFIEQLLAFGPRRIVYVSCHPASQARDLATFAASSYEIRCVQPFDLFPQTRHTECVVTLEREW